MIIQPFIILSVYKKIPKSICSKLNFINQKICDKNTDSSKMRRKENPAKIRVVIYKNQCQNLK